MKIFLDAGHGGVNPGAVGANGLHEADVTLDIILRLGRLLTSYGYEVNYSRTTDKTVSLSGRAEMANQWRADYFVGGTSTFYYKRGTIAQSFADVVNTSLVRQIELRDIGTFSANFAVLRLTRMPAILVEVAFISNPYEASLLATPSFRQNCAVGIFNGIIEFTT